MWLSTDYQFKQLCRSIQPLKYEVYTVRPKSEKTQDLYGWFMCDPRAPDGLSESVEIQPVVNTGFTFRALVVMDGAGDLEIFVHEI